MFWSLNIEIYLQFGALDLGFFGLRKPFDAIIL